MSADVQTAWAPDPKFVSDLRTMLDDCGPSVKQDQQVINVIEACLDEGINRRRQIREVGVQLGFTPSYVVIILNTNTGFNPARCRWKSTRRLSNIAVTRRD
jgi:hypothetical protein